MKVEFIKVYLVVMFDLDRGWVIVVMVGILKFDFFKWNIIKKLISENVDLVFFVMSYDYVGEVSEIVVYLWFYYMFVSFLFLFSEIVEIF